MPVLPRLDDYDDVADVSHTTDSIKISDLRTRLTIMTGRRAGEVIDIDKRDLVIGRGAHADLSLEDGGVSRRHCRLHYFGWSHLVEDLGSSNGTFVNGNRVQSAKLRHGDRIELGRNAILQLSELAGIEETLSRRYLEASIRDPLTKIFNRGYFFVRLAQEISSATREESPLSVMVLALDVSKTTNDSCGQEAGDHVLREVAQSLSRTIRMEDVLARHGEKAFAVIQRTALAEATACAERVREGIATGAFESRGTMLQVAVSIGVAQVSECGDDPNCDALVGLAETRLQRAKMRGRNEVCASGTTEATQTEEADAGILSWSEILSLPG
jgi:diguanylate cyclase (GGDEF)-like protein